MYQSRLPTGVTVKIVPVKVTSRCISRLEIRVVKGWKWRNAQTRTIKLCLRRAALSGQYKSIKSRHLFACKIMHLTGQAHECRVSVV